jgi:hypothetical protein
MFSTGLNSGDFGGKARMVMLAVTTNLAAIVQKIPKNSVGPV